MTTAILISGHMRTADLCHDSIKRHILDRIGLHRIYINVGDDADGWKAALFDASISLRQNQPTLAEKNYAEHLALGCYGVQVVLRQLWSLQGAWDLMRADKYAPDYVIRLRPDCYFHNDIEPLEEIAPRAIYVPTFHNFHGLNDRFALGDYDAMQAYCNRLDTLDKYIAAGGVFQPESHLKWTMERAGVAVKRTRILFDLVRAGGLHVKPEWNKDCEYGDVLSA